MEITRLPKITEDTDSALKEIRSYIIRLDRQLSLLLDNVGSENLAPELYSHVYTEASNVANGLKNEIIETATQIKAVSDEINLRLQSDYVAKSEIGDYTEQAFHDIRVDGKGITQLFEEISSVTERVSSAEQSVADNENACIKVNSDISKINAYIRTGKLEDGVYGIEIGNFSDGSTAPYKVRLSESKLSFYIADTEVAYFSDNSMFINRATVPYQLTLGGCSVKNENGLVFTYE